MLRAALGVIAGYATWSIIWIAANALLFKEAAEVVGRGEPYMRTSPYIGVLVVSLVCSLAGGAVCAVIAGKKATPAAVVTGVLLLLTGIGVQAGVWTLMPVWYHLSFLALLIPVTLAGARLAARKA